MPLPEKEDPMKKLFVVAVMALALTGAVFAGGSRERGAALEPIPSSECPPEARGHFDVFFCDKDGDLLADMPEDERFWLDPQTLVFAYTPVEDPAIYEDMWQPFLDHLAKVTGRNVQFFSVSSYTAQVEAMRAGRLHIAGISTGPTPFAVNLAGYVPIAIMGGADGQFGYTLQMYVHADSDLHSLEDLKGKRVAHVTPTSNSGHQAPMALFPRYGLTPGVDYEPVFSGSHENSALGVVARDYDAAPVASEVVDRMAERGLFNPADVRIIFETDPFPTTSYGIAHRLHPDLQEKIREAFFSYSFAGTPLGDEFEVDGFIPIVYKDHWDAVRTIQEYNGVQYRLSDID
ncbi:phosphonate ABC transporter substrate-binding protein [Alkalispirochaeta sphaeroplastigenens]|uniref:Phosphonate ABC transporter substrate-binding protein n=2 Tax=Alkalispirochaeta sphaeroplastigenens TaxID=1187066 RepID=A0A2S4K151_9SPIO|nr:phosphonate ABC transporter substrate-binding protein [Alkalispirochaeta sphaeroplastigenens]